MHIQYSNYRKEWVRSSNPYIISLTLEKIKDILQLNSSMDVECFNLGVRMVANNEMMYMWEPSCHMLDLKLSVCIYL